MKLNAERICINKVFSHDSWLFRALLISFQYCGQFYLSHRIYSLHHSSVGEPFHGTRSQQSLVKLNQRAQSIFGLMMSLVALFGQILIFSRYLQLDADRDEVTLWCFVSSWCYRGRKIHASWQGRLERSRWLHRIYFRVKPFIFVIIDIRSTLVSF